MKMKLAIALGIAAVLALALAAGGWFVYSAYAQTPTPQTTNGFGGCHNAQAVLDLLQTNAADLQAQRQAGKSLLDIATAKGVSEKALTDALMQPIESMHSWMGQNNPGFNDDQMDQAMEAQIASDIRQSKYGTMTDYRLFSTPGSMMGGYNGTFPGGMMNGRGGMMGGWNGQNGQNNQNGQNGQNGNRPGGMMNGRGGMMGGRTN